MVTPEKHHNLILFFYKQRGDTVKGLLILIVVLIVVAVSLSKIGLYLLERQLKAKNTFPYR